MRFRPCIDLHNGRVKQIVGASLKDGDQDGTVSFAVENFVAAKDAVYYADLFAKEQLSGGHVIFLNAAGTPEYEATKKEALSVLKAYPGQWQVGGGITVENAASFLDAGASHVIVTSFVFRDGAIDEARLQQLVRAVGKERLVLDLSCKKVVTPDSAPEYRVVTDRWMRLTKTVLSRETLERLSRSCDEFLVHAADVEGRQQGIETRVVEILAQAQDTVCTYAGGIHTMEDIALIRDAGQGRIDFTVGSALDVYGGSLSIEQVVSESGGR
ncbi:MAG: phosphoribosylformimino-5-aminoimidazole carboxamide ribotide isomerase, partial [Lachnospiraceae bacterium]|nr:phosphoribosylformimino-5-aminoimidazole carboxamide ribotide isomerase [Lachnospiraceae bacterium]